MAPDEKEELLEILQVLDDVFKRIDLAFSNSINHPNICDNLAQSAKALVHCKERLKQLAMRKKIKSNNGAW